MNCLVLSVRLAFCCCVSADIRSFCPSFRSGLLLLISFPSRSTCTFFTTTTIRHGPGRLRTVFTLDSCIKIAGRLADVYWCYIRAAVGLRGVYPTEYDRTLDAMPASWRRGEEDRVKIVVVERDGVNGREAVGIRIEPPTPIEKRIFRRFHAKRQVSAPTVPIPTEVEVESDSDSDWEDELESATPTNRPFTLTPSAPTKTPAVRTRKTTSETRH